MRLRVLHSKSKEMTVYRKLYWNPERKAGLIGFTSIALLSLGTFMLIPTPEDVLVVGGLSKYFVSHYDFSGEKSIFYGIAVYKALALLLIAIASILGGEYVREKFQRRVIAKVNHHREKLANFIRPK